MLNNIAGLLDELHHPALAARAGRQARARATPHTDPQPTVAVLRGLPWPGSWATSARKPACAPS